ncbi:MAG: KilA-N domain-containing protein, partial [Bacteroidetes bacterium]|nr:KilA-N domain-containing protein [Bacteroidota bacterium]
MAKTKQKITVSGREITITQIQKEDYISLTDMVGEDKRSSLVIQNWLRNKNTLEFLGVWEKTYNPNFKGFKFEAFYNQAGLDRFAISVTEWIEETDAIGIITKRGRGGGTYAHRDIAFEFGSRISAEFKLFLIRDYIRLKEEESNKQKLQWNYQRFLAKVNYRLHTDTIRDKIIPRLQDRKDKQWLVYADEADLLNMAVFGQTARQWREDNPEQARNGNIRDYADIIQLNVLANLESLNSVLIDQGMDKESRFELLSQTAITQYRRLAEHQDLKYL